LWLALDCLQDPQNVGAIFRSAGFFGLQGIIITKDKSAPMNSTVYDVSAGGTEAVPFGTVTNLAQALRKCKERGIWVLGTSEHAEVDVRTVDRGRAWLLVIGNEQKGLRRLTREHCDEVCRIEPQGDVTSLNASVAAGVCMAVLTLPDPA
jgi:23S rRNA (guanosine2251-2'-O)-methyltransferase